MEKILHLQPPIGRGSKQASSRYSGLLGRLVRSCKMLAPTFERLAEKYGEQITFAKVNIDEMPEVANKFAIRSIPTLVLLQAGHVVETMVGLRSEQELAQVLSRYANGNNEVSAPSA